MSNALRKAVERLRVAEGLAQEQMKHDYPIYGAVRWDGKHRGHVTAHGHCLRLKVCNERTRKEYWLHVHRILP